VLGFFAKLEPCTVGMEACSTGTIGDVNCGRWAMR
jgi:hypothetical protein